MLAADWVQDLSFIMILHYRLPLATQAAAGLHLLRVSNLQSSVLFFSITANSFEPLPRVPPLFSTVVGVKEKACLSGSNELACKREE